MTRPICVEDIDVGLRRERARTITQADIDAFAALSGDRNPVHLDPHFAADTPFGGVVAHGMLTAALISAVLGEDLPGPGAIYLSQSLRFRGPVRPGETVRAVCEVREINRERARLTIDCACLVVDRLVLEGEARVIAPRRNEAGPGPASRAGACAAAEA